MSLIAAAQYLGAAAVLGEGSRGAHDELCFNSLRLMLCVMLFLRVGIYSCNFD